MSQPIDRPTNLEVRALREEHDDIIIAGSPNGDERVLHIPDGDDTGPACRRDYNGHGSNGKTATSYNRKNIAVYPRGYKEWCKYCVDLWRGNV